MKTLDVCIPLFPQTAEERGQSRSRWQTQEMCCNISIATIASGHISQRGAHFTQEGGSGRHQSLTSSWRQLAEKLTANGLWHAIDALDVASLEWGRPIPEA